MSMYIYSLYLDSTTWAQYGLIRGAHVGFLVCAPLTGAHLVPMSKPT